ncbi:MAG: O-antigen ligase family protein [Terriglobales bacterium]
MQGNLTGRPAKSWFSWGLIAGFVAVAAFGCFFMPILPAVRFDDGTIPILADAGLFFIILCVVVGTSILKKVDQRQLILRLALTIWWMLLVDEVFFSRTNTSFGMGTGQFSLYAYAEGAMWLVCGAILFILTLRSPGYLVQLFKGSSKWVTFFVLICVMSIAWAPGPMYAAAWGFKLVLTVCLLQLCASLMVDISDIQLFLKVTAVAFVFLTVLPVYYAIGDPDGFWFEGRLNADPDLLSPLAASLMVMSMMLYTMTKKRYWVNIGVVAAVVMMMAFGKAGVIGGFIAAGIFMLLQKRVVRSLGLLLGLGALAMFIISVTPLGNYLDTYHGGSTLTGRTVIWTHAIAAIQQHPIMGWGYLGTYFSWENTSGLARGAVHLHNGFLEVAYNNGAVGELLLLTIHFVMLRNILSSMRTCKILRSLRPTSEKAWHAYLLTIGCLGLYVHTFLQGVFGAQFGGRCMSPYMLWLALVMLTTVTRRVSEGLLQQAMRTRTPLYTVTDLETLQLAPAEN